MVVSSIFSLSSLSNLLKYENVRASDAEDEGRKGASHEAEKTKVFTKPKKRKYSLSRKNESIH